MGNDIASRQNEENSIRMLAAQRQIYSNIKNNNALTMLLSIGLPLLIYLLISWKEEFYGIDTNVACSFISIIASLIVLLLDFHNSNYVSKAAFIQQKFDLYVYGMSWNADMYGEDKNVNEDIVEYSSRICENSKERAKLLNWYVGEISTDNGYENIYKCQKQNFSWDYDLRNFYEKCCKIILTTIIVLLVLWGLFDNLYMREWICVLSYYMPLIVSLISIIIRIENDKSTLLSIKQTLDYKAKLSMHRLELVQRDIYEHRKKCFLIPDRIYRFLKDKQEKKQKDMTLFR